MWRFGQRKRGSFDEAAEAVYRKDLDRLRKMPDEVVSLRDEDSRTLLMHAVLAEHPDSGVLADLVSRGCDVNAKDHQGWTALHFAARDQKRSVVQRLLESGADADVEDDYGNTPLSNAVFNRSPDLRLIQLLLSAGSRPDRPNRAGVSALKTARDMGLREVVALLQFTSE